MCLLYAGLAIAVRGPWVLILALPLVLILRYGVVAREEEYLERRFGDAYRDYRGGPPLALGVEREWGGGCRR